MRDFARDERRSRLGLGNREMPAMESVTAVFFAGAITGMATALIVVLWCVN